MGTQRNIWKWEEEETTKFNQYKVLFDIVQYVWGGEKLYYLQSIHKNTAVCQLIGAAEAERHFYTDKLEWRDRWVVLFSSCEAEITGWCPDWRSSRSCLHKAPRHCQLRSSPITHLWPPVPKAVYTDWDMTFPWQDFGGGQVCEGMDGCRYDDEEKGQSRQRGGR